MWRYLIKRSLYMLFTVWVISLISFEVIQLPPGDYVTSLVQQMITITGRELTPATEQQLRQQYGLNNQPMFSITNGSPTF